ncbi:hypothetical protein [Methyloceanibacter stevinii]|uniref:hypothetical protein n=1 Tax=Methyloceanibacter stevinii TaxID=1774970 RepID=UPI0013012D75|nr:hypothetical protein [Methyloceanibacter stevinii]
MNNGLLLLAVGLAVLFLLSLALRSRMLIVTTGALLAIALATLIPNLSGTAANAPENAERFLRVATFNMWGKGDLHLQKVEAFLAKTEPDAWCWKRSAGSTRGSFATCRTSTPTKRASTAS